MNVDHISLMKILHYTINEFILNVKKSFLPDVVDLQKVFGEIVKRRELIIHNLKEFVLSASTKTCLESKGLCILGLNDSSEWENSFKKRIGTLAEEVISQDLLEIALNGNESLKITEDELHNLLYFGMLKDNTSFSPSYFEKENKFDLYSSFFLPASPVDERLPPVAFPSNIKLSSQFESACMQFYNEVTEMRKIAEKGYSVSDIKKFNVVAVSEHEHSEPTAKTNKLQKVNKDLDGTELSLKSSSGNCSAFLDDFNIEEFYGDPQDSFVYSWEDCLGRTFLREHMYISEVMPEAAAANISGKEYQVYSSLVSQADAVSEDEVLLDILDVLTGTPSNTFFYDIHSRKFKTKAGVHLKNLSFECTTKIFQNFLESGSMYYALQKFSKDFLHASEGSVFKGMQRGVQQVLSVYKEYIEAVKVNSPRMVLLKNEIIKNAELMLNFGIICGIDPEKMIINEIPKGLGLLSYLHDVARSHKRKENGILIAVLLKHAYASYFSFLNKWMTEGHCHDPHNEFQIIEDPNYLKRRDYLFWKFAYTENIDDSTRIVPPELKDFSQGILDCGKSIKLLKFLSSELHSLQFLFYKPPPSLSMVYSFPAVIHKVEECASYIELIEKVDSAPDSRGSDLSHDRLCIEKQKMVNREQMLGLVKRRHDVITACKLAKILNTEKVPTYQTECQADKWDDDDSKSRCSCLPVTITENEVKLDRGLLNSVGLLFSSSLKKCKHGYNIIIENSSSSNFTDFSGKVYHNIGLLFSSCGYIEKSDGLCDAEMKFSCLNFGRQLCLSSYTHYSPPSEKLLPDKRSALPSYVKENVIKTLKIIGVSTSNGSSTKNALLDSVTTDMSNVEKGSIVSTCEDKNRYTLMHKLVSLLVSECNDSMDDIYSYIQVTSLQRLMIHNFHTVLNTRIHVVNKAIMKCIVKEYRLDSLLSGLQSVYFLQDECFSQSLCRPLFERVMACGTPGEFAKYSDLNEIFQNSISDLGSAHNFLTFTVNVNIDFLSLDTPLERIDFLRLFIVECKVNWPLNIIVHHVCLQQYLRIFSTLLEIEFLCWLLGKTWEHLIRVSKDLHIEDAPQYRAIMLRRFEMDQFIRVIRNSIHQHLQGPLWAVLEKSLSAEESGVDDLETAHNRYIEKVLARCFLTDETYKLHNLLSAMFHEVFNVCNTVLDCVWRKNEQSGNYETGVFRKLIQAFDIFAQHQKVFLSLWLQNTTVIDSNNEGVINKKVWTLLGQRL